LLVSCASDPFFIMTVSESLTGEASLGVWRQLLAAVVATSVAACGPPYTVRLTHAINVLNRGNSADLSSLDPHYIQANNEAYVVGDCLMGLTTEGLGAVPIPGAATHWESSADARTWTFHLRNHVWSDGVPVTANDFVFAWRRLLDPKNAAPYAYYIYFVDNARAINDGKLPTERLGIEAQDDKTLTIHLNEPVPILPQLLMHQTTYPVPRHVVLAKGKDWVKPENYACNGPYVFKEWIPNDHVTMVKNPRFYDAAHVRIETVNYFPISDTQQALKWFTAGQLDSQELIPTTELDWMKKNMPATLELTPYLGNSYIIFNFQNSKFVDRRVREAMNLAYDRDVIARKIIRIDQPAYAFVPPGIANYPGTAVLSFKSMPFAARLARARALMAEAGYGPANHLHTSYTSTSSPDTSRTGAAFQAMMRLIYIDIDIVNIDPSTYYRTLSTRQFELAPAAWIADFNDASTFLDLLETGGGQNYGSYSSPAFDKIYSQAKQEPNLVKRGALMNKAEQIALDDNAIIPSRMRVTQNLVQPYVKGWRSARVNVLNFHRTRWLSIDPAAAR
jgi:oligopeptide transport system substrate-binding protein